MNLDWTGYWARNMLLKECDEARSKKDDVDLSSLCNHVGEVLVLLSKRTATKPHARRDHVFETLWEGGDCDNFT